MVNRLSYRLQCVPVNFNLNGIEKIKSAPIDLELTCVDKGTFSMKIAALISRLLLGLIFVVFGLNGFFNFMPMPEDIPLEAQFFTQALMSTGYMMAFIKGTEVVVGVLFLLNCFTPLALVVIAPISINIFLMHLFLAPSGLPIAIAINAMVVLLAWHHKEVFQPILKMKARSS